MSKNIMLGFNIGNTIIGEVKEQTETTITIINPMELVTVPAEGRVQISMLPFKFFFRDCINPEVTIELRKTLFTKPLDEFPGLNEGYETEVAKAKEAATVSAKPKLEI